MLNSSIKKYKIIGALINLLVLPSIFILAGFLIFNKRIWDLDYTDFIAGLFYCSITRILTLAIFTFIIRNRLPIFIIALITAIIAVTFTYYFVNSFGITRTNFTDPQMIKQSIVMFIIGFILPYSETFFQEFLKDKYFK